MNTSDIIEIIIAFVATVIAVVQFIAYMKDVHERKNKKKASAKIAKLAGEVVSMIQSSNTVKNVFSKDNLKKVTETFLIAGIEENTKKQS